MFKIAVLSGKGGTGKTLVSTNLANVIANSRRVHLLDCDVEEPNSHLFFDVEYFDEFVVNILLPVVNQDECNHCRKCTEACEFGAIMASPTKTVVFEALCHGCGLCTMVCPTKAISEVDKTIGIVKKGRVGDSNLAYSMGLLNIGEPSGVRIIRELKKQTSEKDEIIILDSPPGASCPVVETLRGADFAILVTESSPFGMHDLLIALDVVRDMKIPVGVIINRYDERFTEMEKELKDKQIPVLMKIPFDKQIAKIYSEGQLFTEYISQWYTEFERLANLLTEGKL